MDASMFAGVSAPTEDVSVRYAAVDCSMDKVTIHMTEVKAACLYEALPEDVKSELRANGDFTSYRVTATKPGIRLISEVYTENAKGEPVTKNLTFNFNMGIIITDSHGNRVPSFSQSKAAEIATAFNLNDVEREMFFALTNEEIKTRWADRMTELMKDISDGGAVSDRDLSTGAPLCIDDKEAIRVMSQLASPEYCEKILTLFSKTQDGCGRRTLVNIKATPAGLDEDKKIVHTYKVKPA